MVYVLVCGNNVVLFFCYVVIVWGIFNKVKGHCIPLFPI